MNIGDLILFKNNQFIAVNKPPALAVQPGKSEEKALLDLAEIYCKKRLFLVNRIDRPASGIVLFAKNKSALAHLNRQFHDRIVEKTYLAVVKNHPPQKTDTLVHFLLKKQEINKSFAHRQQIAYSKKAVMEYKVIDSIRDYHLLEVQLLTGRHHQIRAQLAAIGSPIRGDVKYGFNRRNPDRSIQLHAWQMGFTHPVSGENIRIQAPLPSESIWEAFEFNRGLTVEEGNR